MLFLDTEVEYTYAMGSAFNVRLAGIDRLMVPGTNVVVASRHRIFNFVELGFGIEFPVAVVFGGNVPRCRVANDFSHLGHIGMGRLLPVD